MLVFKKLVFTKYTSTQVSRISTISDTTCNADQFQCKAGDCKYIDNDNCNGPCIRSSWVNDGEADCTDGSDEGEYFDKK